MKDNKKQKITLIQYKDSYDIYFEGINMENLIGLEIEEGQGVINMGRHVFPDSLPFIKLNLEVEVPRDKLSIIRK